MKLIIAGGRDLYLNSPLSIEAFLQSLNIWPTEIVSGGARGIDMLGEEYSANRNITLKVFHADWEEHGKAAGPIRNKQMAEYGDKLLLIWDGESKGSANMKKEMLRLNKPVYEIVLREYKGKEPKITNNIITDMGND